MRRRSTHEAPYAGRPPSCLISKYLRTAWKRNRHASRPRHRVTCIRLEGSCCRSGPPVFYAPHDLMHVGQILSGKVPYHYYTREAQVVHAVSRGMTPRRPSSVLVTERRWMFIRRCWSTVDIAQSRPSSEEIVAFTRGELVDAGAS